MTRLGYMLRHVRQFSTRTSSTSKDKLAPRGRHLLGMDILPHHSSKFWCCTMGGVRYFCDAPKLSPMQQSMNILMSHPSVERCEMFSDVVYIVRKQAPTKSKLLDGSVEEWELRDYTLEKLRSSGSDHVVPALRFVDFLPDSSGKQVPFNFIHILDALFEDADTSRNDSLSFEEFAIFCHRMKLFSDEDEMRDSFFSVCTRPSAAELLFAGGGDVFQMQEEVEMNVMRFYEFQKLLFDAGLVEVMNNSKSHGSAATYFIDDRVVDIVLRRWLATYDTNGDGCLDFGEYAQLVEDYQLHFAVSEEAFRRLTKDGKLELDDFRAVLEQSGLLLTGTSVDKDDEVGKIWRDIEDSQQFVQPVSVFVADGRSGTSPVKQRGSLRFVCISDTHCRHRDLTAKLPVGDVLLHAGDFSMSGRLEEVIDFAEWIQSLPFKRKVVIAGNHDLTFDRSYSGDHGKSDDNAEVVRQAFANVTGNDSGVVYLEDEEYCFQGVRIYGSPWQPEFGYWAFNLPREKLLEKWRAVPTGIDILMVHGPPLGRGDVVDPAAKHIGCAHLLSEIQNRIRPAYAIYGHVHEGAGVSFDGTTHFLNAASLDEHYDGVHAPLVFDFPISEDYINEAMT